MTEQDKQTVIQLTTTEQYPLNGSLFPTITHCRVVEFKLETPRPINNKPGKINIWLAKGFLAGTPEWFYEAPGLDGINIVIEEPELWLFGAINIDSGNLMPEVLKTISQYLIDKEYIDGTIVVIDN